MIAVALPELIWHDILDALTMAAEVRENRLLDCPHCVELSDAPIPACHNHFYCLEEAAQLHAVTADVLKRLAVAAPASFATAVPS